jgi:hypothetical protein
VPGKDAKEGNRTMKIELELNRKQASLLRRMVAMGIWGLTVEEVIIRLLDRMLWKIFCKPGGTDAR